MILNDREIERLAEREGMISPFSRKHLNSFGYDLTLSKDFLIPVPSFVKVVVVDPLNMGEVDYIKFMGDVCIIPPNSFILGCSNETIIMPRDVVGICLGRSTYARCGIITNVTPLEAGWIGKVTFEISNSNTLPAKVYADKGIFQVLFFRGETPERDYVEKGGRYQHQDKITLPKGEL